MSCCPPYIQSFSSAAAVTIPFGDTFKKKYGIAPIVEVYVFDPLVGDYVLYQYPGIRIGLSNIFVDVGGAGTGYVKMS